jgi:RNA polymerase sigma-70 factor (ECF subfamily)
MISIADIKNGDEAVFTRLFNDYYAKVYHYLLKKTRSPYMAREIAQLTFIKLWQFRHTLSEQHTLDIQLFRIAAGSLIDYLRKENTRRKNGLLLARDLPAARHEEAGISLEASDYLDVLAETLSPVRKKVFILSRVQGHSHREIADKLSISVKTVEDHMMKAMRHLRAIVSHLLY